MLGNSMISEFGFMSGVFYGGIPIEQVNFESEFDKEIAALEKRIKELKESKKMENASDSDYQYWAMKLHGANKVLEISQVSPSLFANNDSPN